ncbi:hypothetical protein [Acinetobacter sp. KS-LM10]|uniref:hypothetical protein n=1 Tax=Acinetobacter sp. KS-LM10 TaxID=3120518 RepID=UPI0030CF53DF
MIITDNKKAQNLDGTGLIDVITQDVNNMTNITQFSQGKQVQVSEHQLRRLLGFVSVANIAFNELQALTGVIAEKSEDYSVAQTLARLASSLANNFSDECSEEFDFFKECSPQLVSTFAEELAA